MIGIIGGTGLMGKQLCRHLSQQPELPLRIASRTPSQQQNECVQWSRIDLADGQGLGRFLQDVHQLVHLAWNQQPLVDVGGTWRLAYRAAQYQVQHLLYLSPAQPDLPFSGNRDNRKEAILLMRQSGVPLSVVESQPSFEALLRYCIQTAALPLWAIPNGKKIAPLPASQIAGSLATLLASGNPGQRVVLKGEEQLSLRQLVSLYRRKPNATSTAWESFLAGR